MTQQFNSYEYIQNISKLKTESYIHLYTKVQSRIIHKSQKVETAHMSTYKWMDKQKVARVNTDIHNGIVLSHKKEWTSNACYNIDEPWKHYAKWSKPDTKVQILYDSISMRDLE